MIVFTTIANRAAPIELGGELVKMDWASKTIVERTPIVPTIPVIPEPVPRGWARGGRGIAIGQKEIFVSSYHSIHVFDHDLRPIRQFGNPFFADIHDVALDGQSLWVCSTAIDCAVKVDLYGNTLHLWWPREDSVIAERYGLSPLALAKHSDNRLSYLGNAHLQPGHTHLNTIRLINGRPVALLNRFGCVAALNPTQILIEDDNLVGAHNIVSTASGEILINDTIRQAIRIYNSNGRLCRVISLAKLAPVKAIRRRYWFRRLRVWAAEHSPSHRLSCWFADIAVRGSRPVLVHGLCLTDHGSLLVGISPPTLLEIDLESEQLLSAHVFSEDLQESIVHVECDNRHLFSKVVDHSGTHSAGFLATTSSALS